MKNSLIRVLISLFLCCCLVLNVVSIPARASAAGAIGIIKASTVTGNPYVITAALLIALGIYAGVDSGAFETVANNCVDVLEAAGTWIKDGAMELLRTEDADGNASYYVDSGLMEDVFQWSFSENIISSTLPGAKYYPANSNVFTDPYSSDTYDYPVYRLIFDRKSYTDQLLTVCAVAGATLTRVSSSGTKQTFSPSDSGYAISVQTGYFDYDYLVNSGVPVVHESTSYSNYSPVISDFLSGTLDGDSEYISNYDVTIGTVPAQSSDLTDGTSARQWSEDYTDRGLKVYGGGSGNNNNDGKWFWKLMLPLTAADLLLMSQADEWSGETPKEFDDYTTVEELEIVSRPEVEFGQGLELAPVTSSSPDPGTGTNPDTGTDTDPDTGTNTGTNFLDSLSEFFTPSGDITMYSLDLKDLFPFCIPFDIYDFLAALSADPVPPVFEFDLNLGVATEPMKIDLSNWSDLAAIIRTLELGLFCVGLALKTRELIGG